jgi:hypothetical protein
MATLTVLDNAVFTLWYHEESKIVHHQIHQFIHGEMYRQCLLEGVALLKKYNAHKWLSDDRKNAAILQEDILWSTETWQVDAFEAGWQYWAIVMPEKMVGKLTIQNILSNKIAPGNLTVQTFSDPDLARDWLEKQ